MKPPTAVNFRDLARQLSQLLSGTVSRSFKTERSARKAVCVEGCAGKPPWLVRMVMTDSHRNFSYVVAIVAPHGKQLQVIFHLCDGDGSTRAPRFKLDRKGIVWVARVTMKGRSTDHVRELHFLCDVAKRRVGGGWLVRAAKRPTEFELRVRDGKVRRVGCGYERKPPLRLLWSGFDGSPK